MTGFLIEANVIKEDEAELYEYGLSLIGKKISHMLLILLIGWIGGQLLGMISFLASYICLREYAGGYHAKTSKYCYLCTGVVTLSVLVMFFIFRRLNVGWICICMLISGIIIWRQSPQETPTKPLSEKEKALYGRKARCYLLCLGILFGISVCFLREIAEGIACACIVQMFMLIIGRCLGKIYGIVKKRIC